MPDEVVVPVNPVNEFILTSGQNLPNHSKSIAGRGKFVRPALQNIPEFRTRQEAYRFCAWAITMADLLPDEDGAHTFEQVLEAVHNT